MKLIPLRCRLLAMAALALELGTAIHADSTIQFSATTFTVAESIGFAALNVQRSSDLNTTISVDYATSDGTATNGLKYTSVSGTLTFEPNETNKTILVPILDGGIVEGTKNFQVVLSNPTVGATLGVRTSASVRITDNDRGLQFQVATYSASEEADSVVVAVVRGDNGVLPVTVDFATHDLTATNGVDYTGATNTLSFAPEERIKLVAVPILNNGLKQPNRDFRVTLANPIGPTIGSQRAATVSIVDNDQGLQFAYPSYNVAEDGGVVKISVLRGTDEASSLVTVDATTSDVTAANRLDYIAVTNTLSFAPGETIKLVSVPILNDGIKEPTKTFRLSLSQPTGGAVLGLPTSTTITILDNDPGVGFDQSGYTNACQQGNVFDLTVVRGNDGPLGAVAVDYATADGTAIAGQDYQGVSGTLQFQANETLKSLTIPIVKERATAGIKKFTVTLSNPTSGATLGRASTAVNIVGTYATLSPPFEMALSIGREESLIVLSWRGGQLQRADSPMGPWQLLTNATNPYTLQSPIPTTFYRVTRPRPVNLYIPSSYDGKTSVPLVILLHSYGNRGVDTENYMRFQPLAEARGFLYCYPDSPIDRFGNVAWNATDASTVDFGSNGIEDVGFLRGVIEEVGRQFTVDRKRIYLIGHSNGGFMAYHMACESADIIAGIASLAGMTFLDPGRCVPSEAVNILHIHGTEDSVVPYGGGALTTTDPAFPFVANLPPYPGVVPDVKTWAGYDGASDPLTDSVPSLDLTTDVTGPDTVITRYTNSRPGGAVELWTINGGSHAPTLSSHFSTQVIDWLLAHPKP